MRDQKPTKTFEVLRREVRKVFQDFPYDKLLNISDSRSIEQILNQIRDFINRNYKGISSSQLRLVLDRVERTSNITKVSFRSFLAFRIVRQTDDRAKRILLLFEDLANFLSDKIKKVQSDHASNIQNGYKIFVRIIISYHQYFETLSEDRQKKIKTKVIGHFESTGGIQQLLDLPTSENITRLMNNLKKFVADNGGKIKTHQLRKIHDAFLPIMDIADLKMQLPFLAYTIARQENDQARNLIMLFHELIQYSQPEDLTNIKKISEVIIAFHKYYGKVPAKRETPFRHDIHSFFEKEKIKLSDLLIRQSKRNYKEIETRLKEFIHAFREGLSASQLRNVYEMVRNAKDEKEIQMIRPRLAFVIARQTKNNSRKVLWLLDELTQLVTTSDIKNYQSLFEDILAYHEYYATEPSNSYN